VAYPAAREAWASSSACCRDATKISRRTGSEAASPVGVARRALICCQAVEDLTVISPNEAVWGAWLAAG
jgi:hypothetical protein